eukprot:SAG11_NODE_880_length_6754_cov_29.319760_6_plen_66_part_00
MRQLSAKISQMQELVKHAVSARQDDARLCVHRRAPDTYVVRLRMSSFVSSAPELNMLTNYSVEAD